MKTIIFGTKEIADLAHFYFTHDSFEMPVAFCLDGEFIEESTHLGLPVVPFEEIEKKFHPASHLFFVPLYDNQLRAKKAAEVYEKGYNFASYKSTKSVCWTDKIGRNCFIMENNVIQPYVSIGSNVVLWSGNHIGHHSVIEDNVFFSSHVVLSGKCTVKEFAWLGVNSTIRDGLTIAEGSLIGMGAVVTKSTEPYKKYAGNPAKEIGDVEKK
jgi:sugar O-acyltransferase (sialic acid O-acetyltransferase NeuD family)